MSTKIGETFHCNKCGNTVKVIFSGAGTLVCCGVEMEKIDN